MRSLSRSAVLEKLRGHKREFEGKYSIRRIGVFGSVARDEAIATSDVDIVVEMREPDPFYLVHIRETLSVELECHIDIVALRDSMNEALKARIEREAVYA